MENNIKNKHCAVFSGQEIKYDKKELNNVTLTAVCGGIDLDLSQAIISKDVVIKARTIFGGIDIKVPNNAFVKIKSCSMFGGVENKTTTKEQSQDVPTIYIEAFCLFGGCDIKSCL